MAEYCEQYFGDHLLKQPLSDHPVSRFIHLSTNKLQTNLMLPDRTNRDQT